MPNEREPHHISSARADWQALSGRCIKRGRHSELVVREGFARTAPLWPTSQVISAAVARASVEASTEATTEVIGLDDGLAGFLGGDWYAESRKGREFYYDDNAWIALNLMTTALLQTRGNLVGDSNSATDRARRIVGQLQSGQDPTTGGVLWKVGGNTFNACSTAPSGLAALRIVEAEPRASDRDELIDFAHGCARFVETLRNSDGLIADHVRPDGSIEPSIYSYNQGTSIGLFLQLDRIAQDPEAIERAAEIADSSIAYYREGDRLWHESPAFVAIYLRHLAAFRVHTASDTGLALERTWLDRLSRDARNVRAGFYTEGGVGSYDGSVSLDQAGIVAARYLHVMPPDLLALMC